MSVDLSVRRKIFKNWSLQLLTRTWFIPNDQNRQFLWLDVIFDKKFENIQISSNVRYHLVVDINDRPDGDFIRWKTAVTLLSLGKIKPLIAIEPWWQLDCINGFRRIRYEPGIRYDAGKSFSFTAVSVGKPPSTWNLVLN